MQLNEFIWKDSKGKELLLKDMKDKHLMNTIKMLYNHLAYLVGLPTIMFNHKYNLFFSMWQENPKGMIEGMSHMIKEIKNRIKENKIDSNFDLLVFEMIKINLTKKNINKLHKQLKPKGDTNGQKRISI